MPHAVTDIKQDFICLSPKVITLKADPKLDAHDLSAKLASLKTAAIGGVDEPFELNHAYSEDADPHKVNLSIGMYRTDHGNPFPLPSVQIVEKMMANEHDIARYEYTAIAGDKEFLSLARDLCFGFDEKTDAQHIERIASVQGVGGTGANHLAATFIAKTFQPHSVWLPDPTWNNHFAIWDTAGVKSKTYPYYNDDTRGLNFDGMMHTLSRAEKGDVLLLQACGHNPTGMDPTKEQWKEIAELCQRRDLIVVFDSAYQGFATGDVDHDAWAIRYFFNQTPNINMCVAQSFSKNFGLYGQRVGACHFAFADSCIATNDATIARISYNIRSEYSMCPRAGSEIVKRVLRDHDLHAQWKEDLTIMSARIKTMREALYKALVDLQTPGNWDHLVHQVGMFSYTGLSPEQVTRLREQHHIYMLRSGRISTSGLQPSNVGYVAKCIDDVVRNI